MEINKQKIEFLGIILGEGKIQLQLHIVHIILQFPDKIEDTKKLQAFFGILNYARHAINDLGKKIGPLYNKLSSKGQKFFNQTDVDLVRKIEEEVKSVPPLELSLESEYKVVGPYGCELGWG